MLYKKLKYIGRRCEYIFYSLRKKINVVVFGFKERLIK